jgi:hypothetical protein
MKDTNPKIGLLWGILNETFLKFRVFSVILILLYQILINLSIFYLFINIQNTPEENLIECEKAVDEKLAIDENATPENNEIDEDKIPEIKLNLNSICFTLLFVCNLICSRYPSENDQIVILCLICSHYHLLKTPYLTFSVRKYLFMYIF